MQRIKFMLKYFMHEPLWFKVLILGTLIVSIVFSSSFFSDHTYFQSVSKLAAAIFFWSFAIKFRSNRVTSGILFAAAILCMVLSILGL